MALIWPGVSGGELPGRCGQRRSRITSIDDGFITVHGALANVTVDTVAAWQPLPLAPGSLQDLRRAHGSPLVIRNNTEKAFHAHNTSARNVAYGRFIHGKKLCSDCGRMDHASVQHSRQGEILNIDMPAGAFRGDIGPQERFQLSPQARVEVVPRADAHVSHSSFACPPQARPPASNRRPCWGHRRHLCRYRELELGRSCDGFRARQTRRIWDG